jgi:hypothetical protein
MSEKEGIDTDNSQCEYCGCVLNWPFNRILRHSQPKEQKHKQGNIPICNSCISSLKERHELTINPHTNKLNFVVDQTSQYKF